MWFDGPLLAGQDVLGIIGILHVPLIVAASVPWISGDDRANLGAASVAIAVLVVVVVARFTTMSL